MKTQELHYVWFAVSLFNLTVTDGALKWAFLIKRLILFVCRLSHSADAIISIRSSKPAATEWFLYLPWKSICSRSAFVMSSSRGDRMPFWLTSAKTARTVLSEQCAEPLIKLTDSENEVWKSLSRVPFWTSRILISRKLCASRVYRKVFEVSFQVFKMSLPLRCIHRKGCLCTL